MESFLIENFTFQNVALVCIALYWVYPKVKKWILKDKKMEDTDADLTERVKNLEADMENLKKKVGNDFYTLQDIKRQTQDSLEEREILMRATLAILEGLQEIGANGQTKNARIELKAYLNKKAHQS